MKQTQILYYSHMDTTDQFVYKMLVFRFLNVLHKEYPRFEKWYNNLFIGERLRSGREIACITEDGQIVAVSIWKKELEERKICTLRVAESFRNQGYGRRLMEAGFAYLDTDRPFFTICSKNEKQFSRLLQRYGFSACEERRGYYKWYKSELVFNGSLPEKEMWINEIKIRNYEDELRRFIGKYGEHFNGRLLEQYLLKEFVI